MMAREEQIIKQVEIYTNDVSNLAEWRSDGWEICDDYEYVEKAFINGANWADKTLIEKVCNWISQSYTSGVLDWKNCDSIIEDFKKAMKE